MATDDELLADYAQGPTRVRAALAGMTREQLLARPIEGKWSTQEVIIHLADADIVFAHRLKRILAEDRPTYHAWSENRFVERLAYDAQSAEDAVLQIETTHRQMARIFKSQPPGWLDRAGVHTDRGEQTARTVLEYATWHISHHLTFVKSKRIALGLS